MEAPTKKKVDEYLQADVFCPWCGGENLTSHLMDSDVTIAWRDVECEDCGAEWRDEFSLAAISWNEGKVDVDRVYSDERWDDLKKYLEKRR